MDGLQACRLHPDPAPSTGRRLISRADARVDGPNRPWRGCCWRPNCRTMSLPSGFQENDIMAANTEETVQETIGHSSFMPTYGLPAHLSRVALVAVFGAVLFPLLRSAQG